MKKLLPIFIALTVIVASCSKERKLNRKLDGDWNVVTVNGQAYPAGYSSTVSFDKDKKDNGSVTMTNVDPTGTETSNGKYSLTKDELITITFTDGEMDIMTVTDYDKKNMTITTTGTDQNGVAHVSTIVLKKK